MPYSPEHKRQTRAKITEAARVLFNRHGFAGVTIDAVMESAGLTRGGFYNHFSSKEALYSEAVSSFLHGRGAQWRAEAGVDPSNPTPDMTQRMLKSYLSREHLEDVDGQCPMIALPSDTARQGPEVSAAYQELLEAMVSLFQKGVGTNPGVNREKALALAAMSVGGMVVAHALPKGALAEDVRSAAYAMALTIAEGSAQSPSAS